MNKFNQALAIQKTESIKENEFIFEGFSDKESKELKDVLNVKKPLLPGDISNSEKENILQELKEIESVINQNDELGFEKIIEHYGIQDALYFIENRLLGYGGYRGTIQAQKINYFLLKKGIIIAKEYRRLYKKLMDTIILSILGDSNYTFSQEVMNCLSLEDYKYIFQDMYSNDEDGCRTFDDIYQKYAYKILLYLKDTNRELSDEIYNFIRNSYMFHYTYLLKEYDYDLESAIHLKKMIDLQKTFLPNNESSINWIIQECEKYKNHHRYNDIFNEQSPH